MIAIRPAHDTDRRFIVSAWSSSFRRSEDAGLIQMEDWADVMHAQIERALDRTDVQALVAYETAASPGLFDLYGFIVADLELAPPLVLYVYTKQAYRRSGIARRLFAAAGVDPAMPFHYACRTLFVSELADKIPRAAFRPLLARYPKEKR